MKELSGAWKESVENKLVYPSGGIARQVWKNLFTGEVIVRRYNEIGELIYTNEK